MSLLSKKDVSAWTSELVDGAVEAIDWSAQEAAWREIRNEAQEPLKTISDHLSAGKTIQALECLADAPELLPIALKAAELDRLLGDEDQKPLPLSTSQAEQLKTFELSPDGPVLTAYRFAVRKGDQALVERSQKVIDVAKTLSKPAPELNAWIRALAAAKEKARVIAAEKEAAALKAAQLRKKGIVVTVGLAAAVSLGAAGVYLNTQRTYVEALDAFEELIESGDYTTGWMVPKALLPIEFYPAQIGRMTDILGKRTEIQDVLAAAEQAVLALEFKLTNEAVGSIDVSAEKSTAAAAIDAAPLARRVDLADRVSAAIQAYDTALMKLVAEQKAAFDELEKAYTALDAGAEGAFSLKSLEAWIEDAQSLLKNFQGWRGASLESVVVEVGDAGGLASLGERISIAESVLSEGEAAWSKLQTPESPKEVEGALKRLAGLKSTGFTVDVLEQAERSLPFWQSRRMPSKWEPLDGESIAWLERAQAFEADDFSFSPAAAQRISSLFENPAFTDVWQYFRYNYAGAQSSSLVYTQGPVLTDEALIDELRELYLVNQKVTLLEPTGPSEIVSTANKDGLGRHRGIVYDDGILTLESRVAQQLSDLWDGDVGAFAESPIELLQTAIYDERLASAFRVFLLQWTVDTFADGQTFFYPEWHPELMQASVVADSRGDGPRLLTWLDVLGNELYPASVIGDHNGPDWKDAQKSMADLLDGLGRVPMSFAGLSLGGELRRSPSVPGDDLMILDPKTGRWVKKTEETSLPGVWLPVFAIEKPEVNASAVTLIGRLPDGLKVLF